MARGPVKTHLGPEQRRSRNANENENKRQFKEKKRTEERKRQEEGGGGQRSQRSEGPGLRSPNMRGGCMALTHTHTHIVPPLTFSKLLHKSWQGPSVPSDLVVQRLVWPRRSFQQLWVEQIVCVLLSMLKGRSTGFFLLKSLLKCGFLSITIKRKTTSFPRFLAQSTQGIVEACKTSIH